LDIDRLNRRLADLKNARANFDSNFQEIAERVLPQMADFNTTQTPGAKRTEKMLDSTAALAATKAVASVAAFIWPSNQRYQALASSEPSLNKAHRVKAYFEDLTESLFRARYSPRAAFESQMGEVALQYIVFGTGVMFTDDNVKARSLRYRSLHLAQTYVAEGDAGQIDTVFRCWPWTLRQIEQRWPGKLPEKLAKQLQTRPDDTVEVCHAVMPRTDYDPDRAGYPGMPWASCYYLPSEKAKLDDGGYTSWPFSVMRYMTSPGEVYGRSPAWLAMSNIKVLNQQKRSVLAGAQKAVDPVMLASEDGILSAFNNAPGAINMGGLDSQGRPLIAPLQTGARLDIGLDMMDKEREIIASAFFLDVFRALIENPQMTATQTLELMQERATLMGPMAGRIEAEGLGPLTERELDLLTQAGAVPPMPPELIEAQGEYKIEYTSPMRRAMKSGEGIAITRTLEAATALAQFDPSALDPFNIPKAMRKLADVHGFPADDMRSPEEEKALKEGRKEQTETAQLLEAAPVVSDVAANLTRMQQAGGRPQV
jgi:hypothetical protein